MPIDMFLRTIENRFKMERYVPILRHQSARIEPYGDGGLAREKRTGKRSEELEKKIRSRH